MIVFNLTDVESDQLKNKSLRDTALAVRHVLVAPGESAEVPDDELTRRAAQSFVQLGAMAVDTLPPWYILTKEHSKAPKVAASTVKRRA